MSNTQSFKDMPLWQRSVELAIEICQVSAQLPNADKLILAAQLQEAALAIPTVLARGSKSGKQGFLAALASARQTAAELETLLVIMQNIYSGDAFVGLQDKTIELQSALVTMGQRLSENRPSKDV